MPSAVFPVAFGGLEHGDAIHITSVVGARTRSLEGLVVQASRGLGGRALVEKRPRLALDYRSARSITHDYDRAVLGENALPAAELPLDQQYVTRSFIPAPVRFSGMPDTRWWAFEDSRTNRSSIIEMARHGVRHRPNFHD